MAGLLDDNMFKQMSMLEKLKTLGSGAVNAASLLFTNPSAYQEHGAYPERLKSQLANEAMDLGTNRINRSPLDIAINYGGGYQFGTIPNMTETEADKMAKAWQLRDYMMTTDPAKENDAWKDYQENMAGVRSALESKKVNKILNKSKIATEAANYGRLFK